MSGWKVGKFGMRRFEVMEEKSANAIHINSLHLLETMGIKVVSDEGRRLLKALEEVDGLPETRLSPFPRPALNNRGRPSPEEENKADEIRQLRAALAEELGMDKGILLSNAQIAEIVRSNPNSVDAIQALPGIRRWQMDLLGSEILRVLKRK